MKIKILLVFTWLICSQIPATWAIGMSDMMKDMSHMSMDENGMIMNANHDKLPADCKQVSEDVNVTIRAGHKHALKFPGKMFAFDRQQIDVKPCARLNITFINDDQTRHQLMIHGLPGYIYPQGMFHLELNGEGQLQASLIVPGNKKTYLMHCEIAQHMEKGMKAQIKVGGGDADLPSIPGITEPVRADLYPVAFNKGTWLILAFCSVVGCFLPFFIFKFYNAKKKVS
jgi:plastocyanin